jgi:hypothetical protein
MRRSLSSFLLLAVLGSTFAGAAKIETKQDPKADFKSFHTFTWRFAEGPGGSEIDGPIRAAAESALAERGLSRAAADEKADLVLEYNVGLGDALTAGVAVTADWWGQLVAIPAASSRVTAGLLFLLTRAEGGEPVWGGLLVESGNNDQALLVMRDRAPKYAKRILSRYPAQK